MEYLLPFLATRCHVESTFTKARYLHRAFCAYLTERNLEPIDRKVFLEWMSQRAPEYPYSTARRTFSGIALNEGSGKRPSPERQEDSTKRSRPEIISGIDLSSDQVITVDPLMFIDRTNMPLLGDHATKEMYQAYREWNLVEAARLQQLRQDLESYHVEAGTSPGIQEIQASLEAMQQLLSRELDSMATRHDRNMPAARPRIGATRIRFRSSSNTENNRRSPIDIFDVHRTPADPAPLTPRPNITMAPPPEEIIPTWTPIPEVVIHPDPNPSEVVAPTRIDESRSDEEAPLLPHVDFGSTVRSSFGTTGPGQ
jgi:hypothetical protein